ncbi:LPD7 domain-containing protein [Rahnella rivi]|uniref:LPD7 domain-containing protein n=1 Tax=Rahnella rivi TaxID=2816249 RepID=UPI0039BDA8BD
MEHPEPEMRIWLAIPHDERLKAVAAAGKLADGKNAISWSKDDQLWYARPGAAPERINPWLPDRTLRSGGGDPESDFYDALTSEGLILNGLPVMDGNRQRVATVEDKDGKKSGVYRGFLDGRPAGWFINYHRAETEKSVTNWKASGGEADPHVRLHIRAGMRQSQDDAARARAVTYATQTAKAEALYTRLPPADPQHPYLQRKGITPTDDLRQTRNGALVVPFHDVDGAFRTLQYIPPEGEKYLFTDAPKVGHFLVVGGALRDGEPILYAEGYATARSLNQASDLPVVMTIDAGNMVNVAIVLYARYPNSPHLFMADMDAAKDVNKGMLSAMKAAEYTHGAAIAPQFSPAEVAQGLTDFNDLHQSRGLDGLRAFLDTHLTPVLVTYHQKDNLMSTPSDVENASEQPGPASPVAETPAKPRSGSAKEKAPQVRSLAEQGVSNAEIAARLGIGLSSVYRILKSPTDAADKPAEATVSVPAIETAPVVNTDIKATVGEQPALQVNVPEDKPVVSTVSNEITSESSSTGSTTESTVPDIAAQAQSLREQGLSLAQVAAELNMGVSQTHRLLQTQEPPAALDTATSDLPIPAEGLPVSPGAEPPVVPEPSTMNTGAEAAISPLNTAQAERAESEPAQTAGEAVNQAEVFLNEWARDIELKYPPREDASESEFTEAFSDLEARQRTLLNDADTLNTEQFTQQLIQLMSERKGLMGLWMSSDETVSGVEPDKDCAALEKQLEAKMEQKFASEQGAPTTSVPGEEDAILTGPRRMTPSDEPVPEALRRIDLDKLLSRMTDELHPDGKSVLFKLDGEHAFTDYGNRLVMAEGASHHEEKVLAALLTAAQYYHGRIELTGSDAFKSYAISLIVAHNLDVTMKVASQQAELTAARRAAGQPDAPADAVAGTDPGSAPIKPQSDWASAPTAPPTEPAAATRTEPVTASRGNASTVPETPPEKETSTIKPAVHTPAEKARESVTGKVTACGQAPFRFEPGESESTYITLRTKEGAQTYWGKELAGLLRETRLEPGRMVALQWHGKKPVSIKVPKKDENGVVTHYESVDTHRNQWSLTPIGGDRVQTGSDQLVKMAAFDAARYTQVQHAVVTRLGLDMPAPPVPSDGLYWLKPDGQGSQNPGDALSAPRPEINDKAGELVMSSWAKDGSLDLYLVQGDGHYLQGLVRREGEYQHVLVSMPDNKEAPPMVFNVLTPDGAVPIGSGNGINRANSNPVPRENVVVRLQGDEQVRIAKLDAPSDLSPALHARLGFDERYKVEAGYPKERPAAAPQAAPVTPLRPV